MSNYFRIYDANNNEVIFDNTQVADTGQVLPDYAMEMAQEKSAGGVIKQQIRPGLRFIKTYKMALNETKYIEFMNLLSNASTDYYIEYYTDFIPCILSNNSSISESNNFKIAMQKSDTDTSAGADAVRAFNLLIASVNLL